MTSMQPFPKLDSHVILDRVKNYQFSIFLVIKGKMKMLKNRECPPLCAYLPLLVLPSISSPWIAKGREGRDRQPQRDNAERKHMLIWHTGKWEEPRLAFDQVRVYSIWNATSGIRRSWTALLLESFISPTLYY